MILLAMLRLCIELHESSHNAQYIAIDELGGKNSMLTSLAFGISVQTHLSQEYAGCSL